MILLDTHTWLWLLHDPTQLSTPAQTIITEAENNTSTFYRLAKHKGERKKMGEIDSQDTVEQRTK